MSKSYRGTRAALETKTLSRKCHTGWAANSSTVQCAVIKGRDRRPRERMCPSQIAKSQANQKPQIMPTATSSAVPPLHTAQPQRTNACTCAPQPPPKTDTNRNPPQPPPPSQPPPVAFRAYTDCRAVPTRVPPRHSLPRSAATFHLHQPTNQPTTPPPSTFGPLPLLYQRTFPPSHIIYLSTC